MPGAANGTSGVLVVDDDRAVCTLFVLFLQRLGLAATVAHERAVAERLLTGGLWRLMITDLQLEGHAEGLALVTLAASLSPPVRTILVSGFADAEVVLEAKRRGADLCLAKPISFADFSIAVRSLLPAI